MDKKHLELLDFLLVELCKSQSGTMFRHILTDYKQLTNIEFNYEEKTNFIESYKNVYFTKENIDRLKITQSARQIINEFGSLTEYLRKQETDKLQEIERQNKKPIIVIQSSPSPSNTKNKHKNISAIAKPIAMLSPVVKFIIAIIIAGVGTLLGYILIEWFKTL